MGKIGITYSSALFQLAKEKQNVDEIYNEFKQFIILCENNNKLLIFMKSPLVDNNEKKEFVDKLLVSSTKTFSNFIKVLIDKHRVYYIKDAFLEFEKLYYQYTNKVAVLVETANSLSDKQISDITNIIKVKYNKEAIIKEFINKDLIMGFRVIIDGEEIDMSLDGSYKRLRKILKDRIEVSGN